MADAKVQLGCEVFLKEHVKELQGKSLGFITNHTGLTSDLKPLVEVFLEHGLKLKALFGPEHGIRGEIADGAKIEDQTDPATGITVFSLYGATRKPTPEMLKGLDALIYDIQDVGVRFYTYLWTMAHCLEAAAEAGIPLWVLDRPAPITGNNPNGPVLDPSLKSFVGLYPVTMRTAMTVGEVASFVAGHLEQGPAALRVVKLRGWKRDMWFDQTGLPWVIPSPGMPTLETATVYPGTCVFEGTNVSEGRGMTRPFETIGAPWINGEKLADAANEMKLKGCLFRSTFFEPWFSKFKDTQCGGVQIHVTDRTRFEPIQTALTLVVLLRKLFPEFEFRQANESGRHYFDMLTGTPVVREMILEGKEADEIVLSWQDDLREYNKTRSKYLLY